MPKINPTTVYQTKNYLVITGEEYAQICNNVEVYHFLGLETEQIDTYAYYKALAVIKAMKFLHDSSKHYIAKIEEFKLDGDHPIFSDWYIRVTYRAFDN